jgi:hypothetical protein
VICPSASEGDTLARIGQRSARFGTKLENLGEAVRVVL